MQRTKYVLKARDGVTESIIEGQPYWPDEDGLIEVYNTLHLPILKLHGYTIASQITMLPPTRKAAMPAVDTEELGKSELMVALRERGVSFPDGAGRIELAAIAAEWNAKRGAPPVSDRPKLEINPETVPPKAENAGHDFSKMSRDDLKGWLSARGVAFAGNASTANLIKAAQDVLEALRAKAPPSDMDEAV